MRTTLRDFILELESAGELKRITRPVSPVLEIAALADEEAKKPAAHPPSAAARRNDPRFHGLGGHALLFENVEGSEFPVLINALGSYRRMEMAIGCDRWSKEGATGFDAIAARIASLIKPEPPASFRDLLRKGRDMAPLLRIGPRRVKKGACQEIVWTGDQIDLTRLPLIKCWPLDGDLAAVGYPAYVNASVPGAELLDDPLYRGRYFTFAHIHTIHAADRGKAKPPSHNIGMYRVQLIGRRRLAMHWHMHHDGARHWRSWKALGEPMPVAIVFGGESVLPFSAIAPLPPGISELLFAGFLNGRGIAMCPAKTIPLRVPANAEIVIEGLVHPGAGMPGFDPRDPHAGALGDGALFEGPFGDHTGFYSLPDRYPALDVTAVTMRSNPIFPATVVGLPPQEDYAMGKAVERLFLPLLKTIVPDVLDYDLPLFGCFHNCAVLQVKKEYPLQARRLMHAIWGAGQMAWTKCVIVVDEEVNPHDTEAVFQAVSDHCDPSGDVELVRGPLDVLDHAAPQLGAGTKIGFDATRKWPAERRTSGQLRHNANRAAAVADLSSIPGVADAAPLTPTNHGWLLVRSSDDDASLPRRIADAVSGAGGGRFVIILESQVNIRNFDEALFHWVANMDPGRDRTEADGVIVFDARPKRPGAADSGEPIRDWPPILEGKPIGPLR